MNKVISIDKYQDEKRVEDAFIELLEREVKVEGNVRPLETSLLNRMEALKKSADIAKVRAEIREG